MECVFLVNKENNKRDWQSRWHFPSSSFNYTLDSIVHFEKGRRKVQLLSVEKERSKRGCRRRKSRTTVQKEKNLFSQTLKSFPSMRGMQKQCQMKRQESMSVWLSQSLSIVKRENKRSYSSPFQERTNEAWNEKRRDHEEHHPFSPPLSLELFSTVLWTDYQFAVFFFPTSVCLTFREKKEIDNSMYLTVFP